MNNLIVRVATEDDYEKVFQLQKKRIAYVINLNNNKSSFAIFGDSGNDSMHAEYH